MIVTRCPPTRAPGTTIEYVPFSRVSAPRLSSGILTSAYVRGTPASLVTRPVTTDCWAAAQRGSRATAPMTSSNGRRVIAMFPPTVRGVTGRGSSPGRGGRRHLRNDRRWARRADLCSHIITPTRGPPEGPSVPPVARRQRSHYGKPTLLSPPSNDRPPV